MRIFVGVCALVLVLGACSDAKKASEVPPAAISTSQYRGMSCSQLRAEATLIRKRTPALEAAVEKAYKHDKNMEAVTWILFWPAVFAMDGNDSESHALSQARGELEAIHAMMESKGCRM